MAAAALLAASTGGPAQAAGKNWHIDDFKIPEIWKITKGGGVEVAVIDSGVDASHPDLEGQVEPGKDFGGGQTKDGRADFDGHGTAMASIIAGKGGSSRAAQGVAPEAKIVPLATSARDNVSIDTDGVLKALKYAADHQIKVVCLAMGWTAEDEYAREAVNYALRRDVVIVAAAGNSGNTSNKVEYPASFPGVISVAAVEPDKKIHSTSTHNPHVVLAAPGAEIWAAYNNRGYKMESGTSPATAYVAGVVALLRAKYPDWTAGQVIDRLIKTADDAGEKGKDDYFGYGIVDPYEALTSNLPPGPKQNPLAPDLGASTPEDQPAQPGEPGEDSAGSLLGVYLVLFILVVVGTLVFVLVMLRRSKRRPRQGPPGPWGPLPQQGAPQQFPASPPGGWPPPGRQPPPRWRPPADQ